ncbi:MAG: AAA family ATPase, partial [Ilumatobacteraceae bacterium]
GPRFEPMLRTIATLVTALLDEPDAPFRCEVVDGKLTFWREGATLGSLDLPDGFRSVLALLADIAFGWHELHPEGPDAPVVAEDIEGIVLVDELDLHLHARLQRLIVPRLRRTLPNMQWIVTTHSPFIVGSFDRTEIVVLDRTESTGIRELDRQVLAFTANDIYDWLLDARPVSEAGEDEAAKDEGTTLLYQSPNRNAVQADQLVAKQDELLEQLRSVKA